MKSPGDKVHVNGEKLEATKQCNTRMVTVLSTCNMILVILKGHFSVVLLTVTLITFGI